MPHIVLSTLWMQGAALQYTYKVCMWVSETSTSPHPAGSLVGITLAGPFGADNCTKT